MYLSSSTYSFSLAVILKIQRHTLAHISRVDNSDV